MPGSINNTTEVSSVALPQIQISREELLKLMKNKSINVIFEDCTMLVFELTLKDRKLTITYKHISQDQQERKVKHKVAEYDRKNGIFMSGVSSLFKVGAVFAGAATGMGGVYTLTASVIDSSKENFDSQSQGRQTVHAHAYDSQSAVANEQSQKSRMSADQLQQLLQTLAKVNDARDSSFRNLTASAGG